ncbi:addiction module protein [Pseudomonas aeruginosa]|nr:addiction module protein [Pseudomonas aeruginosa]
MPAAHLPAGGNPHGPPRSCPGRRIRRLPISRCLELIQALLHRAGPEVERQWLRVAEDRLADCRAGSADALPLAEVLKRLGR